MKPIKSPTRLERQREIDAILDKADLKERRFIPLMLKMLKDVGPIHCFLGVKWAPALCVLVGLFCWGLVSQKPAADYSTNLNDCLRVTIFIQPLLLTGISPIACIIEKYMSVWEIRAVCRYNDKYLLAFRMLMMGVVGMFSVGLTLLSVQWAEGAMLLKIFLVSSASYFLCGTVLMASLRFLPEKWFWTVLVLWYGLGLFLLVKNSYQPGLTLWMDDAPLPVLLAAALGAAAFYFWQTRQLALSKTNEKMGGYWKC